MLGLAMQYQSVSLTFTNVGSEFSLIAKDTIMYWCYVIVVQIFLQDTMVCVETKLDCRSPFMFWYIWYQVSPVFPSRARYYFVDEGFLHSVYY